MDYEKKYNEALERARDYYKANLKLGKADKNLVLEDIFPELAEYKDEKIRKGLIKAVSRTFEGNTLFGTDVTREEALAWLEKQESVREIVERCKNSWYNEGKIAGMTEGLADDEKYQQGWHDALEKQSSQILANSYCQEHCKGFQKTGKCFADGDCKAKTTAETIDKVKPEFKVDDWVVIKANGNEHVKQIVRIEYFANGHPQYICSDGLWFGNGTEARLWTIQDAKPGDVLVASDGSIFLFGGVDDSACKYYAALTAGNYIKINKEAKGGYWETSRAVYPATKEQRDLLFQKMEEAGYMWDDEKKEL